MAGPFKREQRIGAGAKSAEPPIRNGIFAATAFSTLPPEAAAGHALSVGRERRQGRLPTFGQLTLVHGP